MPRKEKPSDYLSRVMREQGLTIRSAASRARKQGHHLSELYLSDLVHGRPVNPTLETMKAIAAALDKPESEIAAVFGLKIGTPPSRSQSGSSISQSMVTNTPREPVTRTGEVIGIAVGLIGSGIVVLWPDQRLVGAVFIILGVLGMVIMLMKHRRAKKK